MIDNPKTPAPKQNGEGNPAVAQKGEQNGCSSNGDANSKYHSYNTSCLLKPARFISGKLRTINSGQWIAIGTCGTWALVFVTIGLLFDARRASERQLRAYVSLSEAQVSDITSNQGFTVAIIVKNFGQTPAYNVAASLGVVTISFPLITALPPAVEQIKNATIGPGGTVTLKFIGEPISAELRPRFMQKNAAIYFYGIIKYVDAFEIPRFTNFRTYKGGDSGVSGPLNFSIDDNEAN